MIYLLFICCLIFTDFFAMPPPGRGPCSIPSILVLIFAMSMEELLKFVAAIFHFLSDYF